MQKYKVFLTVAGAWLRQYFLNWPQKFRIFYYFMKNFFFNLFSEFGPGKFNRFFPTESFPTETFQWAYCYWGFTEKNKALTKKLLEPSSVLEYNNNNSILNFEHATKVHYIPHQADNLLSSAEKSIHKTTIVKNACLQSSENMAI